MEEDTYDHYLELLFIEEGNPNNFDREPTLTSSSSSSSNLDKEAPSYRTGPKQN